MYHYQRIRLNRGIRLAVIAVACGFVSIGPASALSPCQDKLGPESKRTAIIDQPANTYLYIVRADNSGLEKARKIHVKSAEWPEPVSLQIVDGVAVNLRGEDLPSLCADSSTTQLWYVHPRIAETYIRVLKRIEYVYRTLEPPTIMNLSLGPPIDAMPIPAEPLEPMNEATRRAAERGLIPVMAIGNKATGGASPGPNPWCYPDWVICVGAATQNGKTVWSRSVEGDFADRRSWPDVVAAGVDIVSTWPSNLAKSAARRQYDESNAAFLASVLPEERSRFTIMSGSSQAAAQVSRAAAQIIYFVQSMALDKQIESGQEMFSLEIPAANFSVNERLGDRLTGVVARHEKNNIEVKYYLDNPWKLVKQLLIDTAVPMPSFPANVVGAGFVEPNYIEKQFGDYGVVNKIVVPVKAM